MRCCWGRRSSLSRARRLTRMRQNRFPVEMISTAEFSQVMKGEKSAKIVKPTPKADKIADVHETKPLPPLAEAKKDVPLPPPPLKRLPDPGEDDAPKPEPQKMAALPPPRPVHRTAETRADRRRRSARRKQNRSRRSRRRTTPKPCDRNPSSGRRTRQGTSQDRAQTHAAKTGAETAAEDRRGRKAAREDEARTGAEARGTAEIRRGLARAAKAQSRPDRDLEVARPRQTAAPAGDRRAIAASGGGRRADGIGDENVALDVGQSREPDHGAVSALLESRADARSN